MKYTGKPWTDNSKQLAKAVLDCLDLNTRTVKRIEFTDPGKYYLSEPLYMTTGIGLVGMEGSWGGSESGVSLIGMYDEPNDGIGLLNWNGATDYLGAGGGLSNINIQKGFKKNGGVGIVLEGTGMKNRCGWWTGRDVLLEGDGVGGGTWTNGLIVRGYFDTDVNAGGIREIGLDNFHISGISNYNVIIQNGRNVCWNGGGTYPTVGNGVVYFGGWGGTRNSTIIKVSNVVFNNTVIIEQCDRFVFDNCIFSQLTILDTATQGRISGICPGSGFWCGSNTVSTSGLYLY